MADAGFFKGTSADQDRRFSDKDMKLLRTMKFPPEFDQKVDMRKVNLPVIRPWIAKKIVAICGFEDEIVIEYANSLLEDESQKSPDPRKIQIYLTNFLTKDAPAFVLDLWKLLLEAQADVTGVPRTFVEEKKEEMRKARANDSRAFEERDRRGGNTSGNTNRLEELMKLDQELKEGRGRGRGRGFGGRGRGGGGRGRGGYGGGGYDDSPRSRDGGWGNRGGGPRRRFSSRSPPPRRGRSRSRSGTRSLTPPSSRGGSPTNGAESSRQRSRSPYTGGKRRRSVTPPRRRFRDSRSPPPRRRSPPLRRHDSRSRSPPPRRRNSRSPPSRRRSSRSPPRRRRKFSSSPSPRRRSPPSRRNRSPSSSSRSPSPPPRRRREPSFTPTASPGRSKSRTPPSTELKIKGSAAAARESEQDNKMKDELQSRENQLKEGLLRSKVINSRKASLS